MSVRTAVAAALAAEIEADPAAIRAWLDEEIGRTPINRVVNYQDVIDIAGPTAMHAVREALESVLADSFDPQNPPAWYATARTALQGLDENVTDAALLTSIAQSHAALADTTPGAGVGTTSGVVLAVLAAMEATSVVTSEAADALRVAGGEVSVRRWSEHGLGGPPGLLRIAEALAALQEEASNGGQ